MNRHADALSDFTECVQAALNRNGHKSDLGSMTSDEIISKMREEVAELVYELEYGYSAPTIEREAADLAVCALAAFIWARGGVVRK